MLAWVQRYKFISQGMNELCAALNSSSEMNFCSTMLSRLGGTCRKGTNEEKTNNYNDMNLPSSYEYKIKTD